MKHLRLRYLWIGVLLAFPSIQGFAQATDPVTRNTEPDWVRMMEDSSTNYFEAVKAYELFWEGRENPLEQIEEREKFGYSPEREAEITRALRDLSPEEASWRQEMIWQCKRFEEWQRDVAPFVQNDGRILSPSERKAMDDARARQLKEAEGKEGQR